MFPAVLLAAGIIDPGEIKARNDEIVRDLHEASRHALDQQYPDAREAAEGVYAP
jgi:TPP-dependent pyruvate/acetoin dehydrogenase alpha subunit